MEKLTPVYDGKAADELTKKELVQAILREYGVAVEENTVKAMNEAFRCGFLEGEKYAKG